MQDTQVRSLGWEDPLEKGVATYWSILTWEIPWTELPEGYSPWGHKESDTTEWLNHHHPTTLGLTPPTSRLALSQQEEASLGSPWLQLHMSERYGVCIPRNTTPPSKTMLFCHWQQYVELEGIMLNEISQTEKEIPYHFTNMWNLKNETSEKT